MAYNETIENLKLALSGYSKDEEALNELYKNALENINKQHTAATERIENQYRTDRNQAYTDTAREERNTLNALASRGLGFSGETAQAKLNSDIILANRFGKLASDKNASVTDLELQFADKKNALAFDQAEKISAYHDRRNKLNAEIAGMELSKEQSEAQIKADMDKLQAELEQKAKELEWQKENAEADRSAEREKYLAQIKADMDKLQAELEQKAKELEWQKENAEANRSAEREKYLLQIKADMAKLQAELDQKAEELAWEKENAEANRSAEREKYLLQIKADMAKLQAELDQKAEELAWEKENAEANRNAEKEQYEAEIRAKKELEILAMETERQLLEAELKAKYNSNNSSSSSSSSSSNSSSNSSNKTDSDKNGYSPSTSAKDLAKQLVSCATGGNSTVKTEKQKYYINKYLLDMKENYNINSDYYNELVLMLKAYGYTASSESDMRIQVITYDSDDTYDTVYKQTYNKNILQGMSESNAKKDATAKATQSRMDYIYSRAKNDTEFKNCCKAIGIDTTTVNDYLKSVSSQTSSSGRPSNNTTNLLK